MKKNQRSVQNVAGKGSESSKTETRQRGRRSLRNDAPHLHRTLAKNGQCQIALSVDNSLNKGTSRSRRDKEKKAVAELGQLLPLGEPIRDQLDKSGVIRIAVANIQLRRLLAGMPVGNLSVASNSAMSGWTGPSPQSAFHPFSSSNKSNQNGKSPADAAEDENNGKKPPKSEARVEELKQFAINVFQTLSGFLIILDHVGKIVDMVGAHVETVIHPDDMKMTSAVLAIGLHSNQMAVLDPEIRFTLRFKCALGRRNAGVTIGGFKPIHFSGRIMANNDCRFIGYGQPLVAYGLNEVRLSPSMFMFRADLSLKMVFVDSRVVALTGYGAGNLLDRSLYELVHTEDVYVLRDAHRNVLSQQQSTSAYYRLLANTGGWLWVRTKFTMVCATRFPQQALILGVTSAISAVEQRGMLCDTIQGVTIIKQSSDVLLGEYSQTFYRNMANSE